MCTSIEDCESETLAGDDRAMSQLAVLAVLLGVAVVLGISLAVFVLVGG